VSHELPHILASLGTALAAGFVVGAEREQRGKPYTFGGARTFPLYSLAGAIGMLLGPVAMAVLGTGVVILIAIAYMRDTGEQSMGMSTEVAALVTFALGALCTARALPLELGDRLLVVAAAASATFTLLSVKQPLHGLIARVSHEDVTATATLLVMSVIVLPLLPNTAVGPWGALNPRHIGLLVLLISAIGFAGYVAVRVLGPNRGLGLTGLLGGFASSTAVTLSFAGRAKGRASLVPSYAVAIVFASSTMFPRVIVEVYAVSPNLGGLTVWPMVAASVGGLGAGLVMYRRARDGGDEREAGTALQVDNPMSIVQALKFAALFTAVMLLARGASHYLDDTGAYVAAVVTGLADVDAITLSLARLYEQGQVGEDVATEAIGLAAATNTASKTALATILGGGRLGLRVALGLATAIAGGAAVSLAL
jgi:uncharacterized membrane protein (DUF4010 family)